MRYLVLLFFCLQQGCLGALLVPLQLEHAITKEQRAKGLMERDHLEHDHGMLFHFPTPQKVSFWMYNTYVDLSIAFMDQNSIIIEIYDMKAYPKVKEESFFYNNRVISKNFVRYALEMNKNWFANHGIKPGDRLIWNLNESTGFILANP
jgi:uncharacterized protein